MGRTASHIARLLGYSARVRLLKNTVSRGEIND